MSSRLLQQDLPRALVVSAVLALVLTAYALWRVASLDRKFDARLSALESGVVRSAPVGITDPPSKNRSVELGLSRELAGIEKRLDRLEVEIPRPTGNQDAEVGAADPADLEAVMASQRAAALDRLARLESPSDEWFWSSGNDGNGERDLAFGPTDGFTVDAVVCRSEWCRVEIEDADLAGGGLEAELELQYKISRSLGRDTTFRMGPGEGSRRVVFIK